MISDIDWHAGTVGLRGRSRCGRDILPLPMETGQALQPTISNMNARPPTIPPLRSMSGRARPAHYIDSHSEGHQTGLPPNRPDSFRACTSPYCGVPPGRERQFAQEIADVLRHRSLNTTLIYAKLDTPRVVCRPLPWPGSGSRSPRNSLQARISDYLSPTSSPGFPVTITGRSLPTLPASLRIGITRGADRRAHGQWASSGQKAAEDHRQPGQPAWPNENIHPLPGNSSSRRARSRMADLRPGTRTRRRTSYHEEIVRLLSAHRSGLRAVCVPLPSGTLFGLMASTGCARFRKPFISRDADVDLKRGMLTIRQTKVAKSTQLPVHSSTVKALARYRRLRARHVPTTAACRF